MSSDPKSIEWRFQHHPPRDPMVAAAHEAWRDACLGLAQHAEILGGGSSREVSLAITKIEEAMFWGNAAIARNHPVNQHRPPTWLKE